MGLPGAAEDEAQVGFWLFGGYVFVGYPGWACSVDGFRWSFPVHSPFLIFMGPGGGWRISRTMSLMPHGRIFLAHCRRAVGVSENWNSQQPQLGFIRGGFMAIPATVLSLTGKYHTVWRVLFVAVSLAITSGITAAVFLFIPPIRESVRLALNEGGYIFVWAVIVPSGIFSAIITVWGIGILWRASDGNAAVED